MYRFNVQQSMYKNRAIDSTVVTKRTLFPQLQRNWKPNTNSAVLNIGLRQYFAISPWFIKDTIFCHCRES